MSALRDSGVPVPKAFCLCEDEAVIGSAFYVMEHVAGRILWVPALPGVSPAERAAIFDSMNAAIAALHRVDYAGAGLADYGGCGNYFARQIGRWTTQYRASETERIDAMERLIECLPAHVPAGDAAALVHGDYRLDDLVFHATAARYCERVGAAPPSAVESNFYVPYNLFRGAATSQGIMKRALDGSAASAHELQAAGRARGGRGGVAAHRRQHWANPQLRLRPATR